MSPLTGKPAPGPSTTPASLRWTAAGLATLAVVLAAGVVVVIVLCFSQPDEDAWRQTETLLGLAALVVIATAWWPVRRIRRGDWLAVLYVVVWLVATVVVLWIWLLTVALVYSPTLSN